MSVIVGIIWITFSLFIISLIFDFIKIVLIEGKTLKEFNKICGEKYK